MSFSTIRTWYEHECPDHDPGALNALKSVSIDAQIVFNAIWRLCGLLGNATYYLPGELWSIEADLGGGPGGGEHVYHAMDVDDLIRANEELLDKGIVYALDNGRYALNLTNPVVSHHYTILAYYYSTLAEYYGQLSCGGLDYIESMSRLTKLPIPIAGVSSETMPAYVTARRRGRYTQAFSNPYAQKSPDPEA